MVYLFDLFSNRKGNIYISSEIGHLINIVINIKINAYSIKYHKLQLVLHVYYII